MSGDVCHSTFASLSLQVFLPSFLPFIACSRTPLPHCVSPPTVAYLVSMEIKEIKLPSGRNNYNDETKSDICKRIAEGQVVGVLRHLILFSFLFACLIAALVQQRLRPFLDFEDRRTASNRCAALAGIIKRWARPPVSF